MKLLGHLMVFKGEDELFANDVVVEFTEVQTGGKVEITFKMPGGKQFYLQFDFGEFVKAMLAQGTTTP